MSELGPSERWTDGGRLKPIPPLQVRTPAEMATALDEFFVSVEVATTQVIRMMRRQAEQAHRAVWWARFWLQVEERNRVRLKGLL